MNRPLWNSQTPLDIQTFIQAINRYSSDKTWYPIVCISFMLNSFIYYIVLRGKCNFPFIKVIFQISVRFYISHPNHYLNRTQILITISQGQHFFATATHLDTHFPDLKINYLYTSPRIMYGSFSSFDASCIPSFNTSPPWSRLLE